MIQDVGVKLRQVFLPFLVMTAISLIGYSAFRWFLDIKLGLLPLKSNTLNVLIPFVLPWIGILFWLRRRLRILAIRGKNDQGHAVYQIIIWIAMLVPLLNSQTYLSTAPFDLIEVNDIDEVRTYHREKYFSLDYARLEKDNQMSFVDVRASGKRNETLNFEVFYAIPFADSENVWYGLSSKQSIRNNATNEEKDNSYRLLLESAALELYEHQFTDAEYLEKLGLSNELEGYLSAIGESKYDQEKQIVLIPGEGSFAERSGNSLKWTCLSFLTGSLIVLLMVIIPRLDDEEVMRLQDGRPPKEDDLKELLQFLNPRGEHPGTAVLLLSIVLVFLGMTISGVHLMSPTANELLQIGGLRRLEVINGEYWRLLTSVFLHSGVVHLVMNLFGLVIGGIMLEPLLGRARLILSYLIAGIIASLASIYWHENTVSVGASGAIFGLYGLILSFTVFRVYPTEMRGFLWLLLGLYAGVSLLFGLFGGIDNAAHIGGLVGGSFIGAILTVVEGEKLKRNADDY